MRVHIHIIYTLLVLCSHTLFAAPHIVSSGAYTTGGVTLKIDFHEPPHSESSVNKANLFPTTHLTLTTRAILVSAYIQIAGKKHRFKINPSQTRGLKSQKLTVDDYPHNVILYCQVKNNISKPQRVVQAVLSVQQQTTTQKNIATPLIIIGKTLITHDKKIPTKNQQQMFDQLAVKFVVTKTEYKIDSAGKSLPQFAKEMRAISRKAFLNGGGTPLTKPIKLGMFLELTNNANKDIKLELGGDKGEVGVTGKGAGFVSIMTAKTHIDEMRGGTGFMLKPGQSHRIPFSMVSGFRSENHNFWTKPGQCLLSLYATCLLHEKIWNWNAPSVRITITGVQVTVHE
ncbi:hypothetical protein [Candidatus Uabimicrobium amorphum]|uniref:Uncharacterized protein n=1 Tax=Uabimicrobium amorphum TaxID=2596890 RepID=A0A5S9IIC9_UABAM|nr:hypothetical protein [Candidatus Uabimicrobium amorphum]BBM82214.1 hypothetical protein UABAM_00557 [Candidatus Uabimicrobium amorphum]